MTISYKPDAIFFYNVNYKNEYTRIDKRNLMKKISNVAVIFHPNNSSIFIFQEHLAKHAGDKPYKCEVCPKQFNHKTDLRRHMCLHTGEKPFSCEVCGKGFIREDRMVKHADTHKKKPPPIIMN